MVKEYSRAEQRRRDQMEDMDLASTHKAVANSRYRDNETRAVSRDTYQGYEDDIAAGRRLTPKSDEKEGYKSGGLVARGMGQAKRGGSYGLC